MTDTGDEQARGAEQLDEVSEEEVSPAEIPPEKPWGAEAYGAGGTETPDGVAERRARENPERDRYVDDRQTAGLSDPDDPFGDDVTAESVADVVDEPGELSAEEAAIHSYSPDEAVDHGLDPDGPAHDGYYDDQS
jgi:hypothetical protein